MEINAHRRRVRLKETRGVGSAEGPKNSGTYAQCPSWGIGILASAEQCGSNGKWISSGVVPSQDARFQAI
jgi:hypothetical protein